MVSVQERIREATGSPVTSVAPLSGGCVSDVFLVSLAGGERIVAKWDEQASASLPIEAYMLDYLQAHSDLPVPEVIHSSDELLLLEYLPGSNSFSRMAEKDAARHLARLHHNTSQSFGLERDTLIGGLHQPNKQESSWLEFYADHRLRYMASQAVQAGRLPERLAIRVDRLCARLSDWLEEPAQPALLHGDAWAGNILASGDRITGFLDPAIYYGDPEIELAFTTLFGTFGQPFFEEYEALRPLRPGFHESRRYLYHLYPLLVHVRLFGGSYVGGVERVLRRFGC